jgi:hypothetical protein
LRAVPLGFSSGLTRKSPGKKGSARDDDSKEADIEAWKKTSATKTATFVDHLQNRLPLARIVYLSATGASDPKHFTNMHRLGLWGQGTAFRDANDFITDMHKVGFPRRVSCA